PRRGWQGILRPEARRSLASRSRVEGPLAARGNRGILGACLQPLRARSCGFWFALRFLLLVKPARLGRATLLFSVQPADFNRHAESSVFIHHRRARGTLAEQLFLVRRQKRAGWGRRMITIAGQPYPLSRIAGALRGDGCPLIA